MKEKILKTVYKISFLPYIGILICAIWGSLSGVPTLIGFVDDQTLIYGFDAFWTVIVSLTMLLIMSGVIPLCLVYQIFYLIRDFIKNKKLK